VIGISAALNLGVYQDIVMLIAAIIADAWLLTRRFPPEAPEKVDEVS
jgi:hypothetical protein